jgi:hypothetical protein
MSLFRTTSAPDEFMSYFPGDGFADIVDEKLPAGVGKSIEAKEYIYLTSGDSQKQSERRTLIISFNISDIHHGGDAEQYWSDLLTLSIPDRCALP